MTISATKIGNQIKITFHQTDSVLFTGSNMESSKTENYGHAKMVAQQILDYCNEIEATNEA